MPWGNLDPIWTGKNLEVRSPSLQLCSIQLTPLSRADQPSNVALGHFPPSPVFCPAQFLYSLGTLQNKLLYKNFISDSVLREKSRKEFKISHSRNLADEIVEANSC